MPQNYVPIFIFAAVVAVLIPLTLILANLVVDVAYAFLDPRVRLQ